MICDKCTNNPKYNPLASGVCHCALPAMEQGLNFTDEIEYITTISIEDTNNGSSSKDFKTV